MKLKQVVCHISLLVLALFGASLPSFAQPLNAPTNLCTRVDQLGDVTLSWQQISDPGNQFLNYEIFTSTDGVTFTSLGFYGPIGNNAFLHVNAQANNSSIYYYVVVRAINSSLDSPPSDTIQTIFLDVVPAALNSVAQISWNSPSAEVEANSDGFFTIRREYPVGTTEVVATVPVGTYTYSDTLFGLCVPDPVDVTYEVLLEYANSSCITASNQVTDGFQDLLGPEIPEVETITVNPLTGNTEIYWYPVSDPDLENYLVQRVDEVNGTFINVGNIDADQPEVFAGSPPPGNGPMTYIVIAFDGCANDNSYNDTYSTMYLTHEYDSCALEVTLSWSPYEGWEEGVSGYSVFADDGNGYGLVGTSTPDERSFTFGVNSGTEYCFYIEAESNGGQRASNSNLTCLTASYPAFSDLTYLSRVSVTEEGNMEVGLRTNAGGENMLFTLERRLAGEANPVWSEIAEVTPQPGETELNYVDEDVPFRDRMYVYRWIPEDACGNLRDTSNNARNMLLFAAVDNENLVNTLNWIPHRGFAGIIASYTIYRRISPETAWQTLASVGGNDTVYYDSVEEELDQSGLFEYRVEAVEAQNPYGRNATAYSNVAFATLEPLAFIPNAFTPGGNNPEFKPIISFVDIRRYSLTIYNRWQQQIFRSTSPNEAWDGTFNGSLVPAGAYLFVLEYSDGAGNNRRRTGNVYVIR